MKIIGMMPVRNEEHILGFSARVALEWVDELVVLLHECTDGSLGIAQHLAYDDGPGGRVEIITVDGSWDEMRHRQQMLDLARRNGATHLAIIDADEVLTANLLPTIRQTIELCPRQSLLEVPLYNLRGGVDRYHQNGTWGQRIVSLAFPDDERLGWSGDQFHSRVPGPLTLRAYRPIQQGMGGVLHFWGASERRLAAKHRYYKIVERLKFPDKPVAEIERMYNWAFQGQRPGEAGTWQFAFTRPEWTAGYEDLMREHLHLDVEPWQEAWCDEQIRIHGHEKFIGLSV